MRNLGPESKKWLDIIGIKNRQDLEQLGAITTYAMIKDFHISAGINLLWALHGELTDQDWKDISEEEKENLIKQIRIN